MKSVFNFYSFRKTLLFILLFTFTGSTALAEVKPPETVAPYAGKGLASPIQLTEQEQAWLDRRLTVRVRVADTPPFQMTTPGPQGISIDTLILIGKRFGINFTFVKSPIIPWKKAVDDLTGERSFLDLLPFIKRTPAREKDIVFTQDYFSAPWVIVNRTNADFVSRMQDLYGKKVAVESGFVVLDLLKKEYPQIRIVQVNSALDALQSVASGLNDAYVANLSIASYLIQRYGLNNLKIAAPTPFGNHDVAMGVRKDWPELARIIDKGLSAMSEAEEREIRNRWLSIRYEYGVNMKKVLIWVIGLTAGFSMIIAVVFIWNRRLRREVNNRILAEEALKKSEALLQSAGKIANIGGWELNIKSKDLRWTEAVYRIYEVDSEFIPSIQTTIDFVAPEARPVISQALQSAIEQGESFDLELPIITAKGNRRVIQAVGEAQSRDEVTITVLGTVQDITERKQAEEALRQSRRAALNIMTDAVEARDRAEQISQALKENERLKTELLVKMNESQKLAMIGSWEWNLRTNDIWWSEETYRIFGVTPQDYVPSFEANGTFIHPDDFDRYGKVFEHSLKSGEQLNYDFRLITNDGRLKHCQAAGNCYYDDSGQPIRFIGTVMDITERKRAEKKLHMSEERYSAFVKQSSEAICLFEIEHAPINTTLPTEEQIDLIYANAIIGECNQVFATSLGFSGPNEMIGFKIGQIFPRLAKENVDFLKGFIQNGHQLSGVATKELSKDGSIKYFLNSLIGQFDNAKLVRIWGVKQDISLIKKAEEDIRILNAELEQRVIERTVQLESANKELEAFSYSVSHDLRAPLRSIDGFSQALLEEYQEILDDTGKGYLERVRKATQRMGLLIDDLLKLSRISRAQCKQESFDLSVLARAIAEENQQNNPDRAVDIIIQEGIMAQVDPSLIRIVLVNLIDNAFKFTAKKAHPRIEFGTAVMDGKAVYYIRDNGAGFDMAYAGKLFGAFQRLHTKEEFPGTGIGLATVQRIINRHGGRVWAEGEVEKGAVFYFTLSA